MVTDADACTLVGTIPIVEAVMNCIVRLKTLSNPVLLAIVLIGCSPAAETETPQGEMTSTTGGPSAGSDSSASSTNAAPSSESGSSTTGALDDDHPLCACLEPRELGPAYVECPSEHEIHCGSFVRPDEPGSTGGPECDEDSDPLECPEIAENIEVLGCVFESFEAGDPFLVVAVGGDSDITDESRVVFMVGPEASLDFRVSFQDQSADWPDALAVSTPDLSPCAALEGSQARWSCIETRFDDAAALAVCIEAGSGSQGD